MFWFIVDDSDGRSRSRSVLGRSRSRSSLFSLKPETETEFDWRPEDRPRTDRDLGFLSRTDRKDLTEDRDRDRGTE